MTDKAIYIITQEQLDAVVEKAAKKVLANALREPKMLLMKEACIELDISEPTLRRMIQNNEIEAYKIGGKWRIDSAEIDRLLPSINQVKYKRYAE